MNDPDVLDEIDRTINQMWKQRNVAGKAKVMQTINQLLDQRLRVTRTDLQPVWTSCGVCGQHVLSKPVRTSKDRIVDLVDCADCDYGRCHRCHKPTLDRTTRYCSCGAEIVFGR
jgi:hypothetical protein